MVADIVNDPLPICDAILCRDFLQHLPTEMAMAVLRRFRRSGSRWLLATTFDAQQNLDIKESGGFRPFNLEIKPVNMVAASKIIDGDGGIGRYLGVWSLL